MDTDTLTIRVKSLDDAMAGSLRAVKSGQADATPVLYFPNAQMLFKTLGGSRWDVIEAPCGQGPLGVRELEHSSARIMRQPPGLSAHVVVEFGVGRRVAKFRISEFRQTPNDGL